MRVVFMGTPEFAASILRELACIHEVVGVYTRPDAVRGRGKTPVSSPVKEEACSLNLPVFTPRTLRDSAEIETLRSLKPDIICVAAYGAILPCEVLEIPPYGCVNVHTSLLPRWRGAAPIERAILAGDEEVGVCIMRMEESLDTGAVCIMRSIPVGSQNVAQLTDELAVLGAQALITALAQIETNNAYWINQDDAQATYAEKIEKGELNLDPHVSALENVRRMRASSLAHPARCVIAQRCVTVTAAIPVDESDETVQAIVREVASAGEQSDAGLNEQPGEQTDVTECSVAQGTAVFIRKRLILFCDQGAFEVLSLKPDGKKDMDAQSFAAGTPALRNVGGTTWEAC